MTSRRAASRTHLYQRRPATVVYWRRGAPIVRDAMSSAERAVDTATLHVLMSLTYPLSSAEVAARVPTVSRAAIAAALDDLTASRFVDRWDPRRPRPAASPAWPYWMPAAGFFHFGTKNDPRGGDLAAETRRLHTRLAETPYPDTLKPRTSGRAPIVLPPFPRSGWFPELLRSRRSWRRFATAPLTRDALSALLGLTWGVQHWMRIAPTVRSALKTSPSGGACHSIEAYVVARRVSGLRAGIYHYRPDDHAIEPVRRGLPRAAITDYLSGQRWFEHCSAIFVMTSVLPRVMWKYHTPRAYRVVLLEAGHFCQTFCLVATWLGLAPFCTAAFSDEKLERDLKIDGIDETAIYVAGVGPRPRGVDWAPWPPSIRKPLLEPPAYTRRHRRTR
jgi:SagB-type dehydrogenase family enzyme